MAPLVHGNDAFTALEMGVEGSAAYNTHPSYPATFVRVPMLGEGFVVKSEPFPKNREMGALGAQSAADFGRRTVEAQFSVYPRYNAAWFHWLLCHAFGGSESVKNQVLPDGAAETGSYSTHAYAPQSFKQVLAGSASGVANGLTFRISKSGNTSDGSRENITGCIIKRMTWEHPEGDRPRVIFDLIGQVGATPYSAVAGSLLQASTADIPVKARDLRNRPGLAECRGIVQCGNGLWGGSDGIIDLPLMNFKIVVESNVEFAPGFLNSPDVIEKPGHVAGWHVTGEIGSLLQQLEFFPGWPGEDFVNKQWSALRIRYVADAAYDIVPGTVPYALDLFAKNIVWTKAENSVTEGGANKTTYSFETQLATFTPSEAAIAANTKNTFLVQVVGQAALYSQPTTGGNATTSIAEQSFAGTPEASNTDAANAAAGWIDIANAFDSDADYATTTLEDADSRYRYALEVPDDATVLGIQIDLSALKAGADTLQLEVSLSSDASGPELTGGTYTTAQTTDDLTLTQETYTLGAADDLWGRAWTPAEVNQIVVRVKAVGTAVAAPDWRLVYLPVNVTYIPV